MSASLPSGSLASWPRRLGHLARAIAAFVWNPLPIHYFAIDRAFVALTPPAAESAFARALRRSDATRAMLDDRFLAAPYTLDDLRAYPPGSLGHVYRDHMIRFGLALDFFPPEDPANEFKYYRVRTFQAHDITHAVTGFGSDIVGEMGVIGFTFGQHRRHIGAAVEALALVYGGLMAWLYLLAAVHRSPRAIPSYLRALARGWRIGLDAAPTMGVRWEERFAEPVDALRRQYAIALPDLGAAAPPALAGQTAAR